MALSSRKKAETARYKPSKKTTTSKKIGTGKPYKSTRKIPKSFTKGSGLDELTPTEFKKIFGKSKGEYVKEINTTYSNEGLRGDTLIAAMQGMRRKIKSYMKNKKK